MALHEECRASCVEELGVGVRGAEAEEAGIADNFVRESVAAQFRRLKGRNEGGGRWRCEWWFGWLR
jgi:hypothetical protein